VCVCVCVLQAREYLRIAQWSDIIMQSNLFQQGYKIGAPIIAGAAAHTDPLYSTVLTCFVFF